MDLLSKLAYACPLSQGFDEESFLKIVEKILNDLPDKGTLACLRQITVESQMLALMQAVTRVG